MAFGFSGNSASGQLPHDQASPSCNKQCAYRQKEPQRNQAGFNQAQGFDSRDIRFRQAVHFAPAENKRQQRAYQPDRKSGREVNQRNGQTALIMKGALRPGKDPYPHGEGKNNRSRGYQHCSLCSHSRVHKSVCQPTLEISGSKRAAFYLYVRIALLGDLCQSVDSESATSSIRIRESVYSHCSR